MATKKLKGNIANVHFIPGAGTMTNRVIIDNCVVIKEVNGIRIIPFKLMKKLFPTVILENMNIKTINTGSRYSDNRLLCQLSEGNMKFEDLIVLLP